MHIYTYIYIYMDRERERKTKHNLNTLPPGSAPRTSNVTRQQTASWPSSHAKKITIAGTSPCAGTAFLSRTRPYLTPIAAYMYMHVYMHILSTLHHTYIHNAQM